MTAKKASSNNSCLTLSIGAAALALAMGLSACAPNNEHTDETQKTIRVANQNLAELKQLEQEIRENGYFLKGTYGPTRNWTKPELTDFTAMKSRLEKFIALGEAVIQTAQRSDVTFQDKDGVAEKVANAKTLLAKVDAMFKSAPAETAKSSI